ncbi:MAG: PspA/IM30 family protein [Chloroflexi bacterium]|nr:PspA/IM30 family protein [Chloroflexota bacterium]
MGMFSRMSTIFKAKVSKALDKAEDPRETLDYSYEKQLEMLQKVKRGIVEVTTAKKRLELQLAKQKEDITKMDGQARAALQQNREDLARVVLTRKASAMETLQSLEAQVANLDNEQAKLVDAESRLAAKVESFRTRKEVIKATYSAAEAQVRIGEAVSGISEEMTDVGMAIDRAENKTAQLQAKASAIDELMVSGVLSDASWGGSSGAGSDIDRELAKLSATSSVDSELARMKSELGAGPAPKQLEPGR